MLRLFTKKWADITPNQVLEIMNNKDIQLIDVREIDEYNQGHIPNIKHIPLSQFVDRINEIDPEQEAIFVCRSGNRSGQVCQYLSTQGYTKLHNMVGGMLEWEGEIE